MKKKTKCREFLFSSVGQDIESLISVVPQ